MGFALGVCACCFTYASEIIPPKYFAACPMIHYLLATLVTNVSPILILRLGTNVIFIFGGFCFVLLIAMDYLNIETLGKQPKEIIESFQETRSFDIFGLAKRCKKDKSNKTDEMKNQSSSIHLQMDAEKTAINEK